MKAVSKWIELYLARSLFLMPFNVRRFSEAWRGRRCLFSLLLPYRELARALRFFKVRLAHLEIGTAFNTHIRALDRVILQVVPQFLPHIILLCPEAARISEHFSVIFRLVLDPMVQ